ncbi:hypothetical protein HK405_009843 [Cladochytrium tenue]|nr:hypothetical protein HK405_009843 [Cladochytrium tenue]
MSHFTCPNCGHSSHVFGGDVADAHDDSARISNSSSTTSSSSPPGHAHDASPTPTPRLARLCASASPPLRVLASLPLAESVCAASDRGTPCVVADPGGVPARAYLGLARRVADELRLQVPSAAAGA